MKVVTDTETIELGATEINPTISFTDYSRRVTDDFGVTTVVRRGFSRRLSVRFALPFTEADGVQRRMAELRATAVQWVAGADLDWLQVRGFFKDFSIDLSVPPISYCTLSIEGLAETEVGADTGGDPAPGGKSSTLQMLRPVDITGPAFVSSNVPENDYPAWAAGTTYALGARVILTGTHRVYESAAAANIGNDPAGASGLWIDIGPTNRWAMLDQALGTITSRVGGISIVLAPGTNNALALLDVAGSTVRVQKAGYDRTIAVGPGAITFLDMPESGGNVSVTISGTGVVSVGTLLVGSLVALGITEASPTAGITDYSRKEVDDFGEVTVVPRAWSKTMGTNALIRTDAIDMVANRIAGVRARPSLWIADEGTDCLTVYGFFKDFSIEVSQNVSKLALSIEGLSEAAPLSRGLPAPNWPDIIDSDPVTHPKPEDGATVGAPPGTPVGDRPAETIIEQIDMSAAAIAVAEAQITQLIGSIGDIEDIGQARDDAVQAKDDAIAAANAAGGSATIASSKRDEASGFASTAEASALTAGDSAAIAGAKAVVASDAASSAATNLSIVVGHRTGMGLSIAGLFPKVLNPDVFTSSGASSEPPSYYAPTLPSWVGPNNAYIQVPNGSNALSFRGVVPVTDGDVFRVTADIEQIVSAAAKTGASVYARVLDANFNMLGNAGPTPGRYLNLAQGERGILSVKVGYNAPGQCDLNITTAGAKYIRFLILTNRIEGGTGDLPGSVSRIYSAYIDDIRSQANAATNAGISAQGAATATAAAASASTNENLTAKYKADTLKLNGNFGFELDKDNWFIDAAATTPLSGHSGSEIVTGANAYFGKDLRQGANQNLSIFSGSMIPVDTSRQYRIWAPVAAWSPAGAGPVSTCYVGFVGLDANGNVVNHGSYGSYRYSAAAPGSWPHNHVQTVSAIVTGEGNDSWVKFPPGTKFIRPMAILNYLNANIYTYISGIFVEDVTERVSSETHAGIAAAQAAIATEKAAATDVSMRQASSLGRGYLNPTANFADWPTAGNTSPGSGWTIWNNQGGATIGRGSVSELSYNPTPEGSDYCIKSVLTSTTTQVGMMSGLLPASAGRYLGEATAYLGDGGSWNGSGLYIQFYGANGSTVLATHNVVFATDSDLAGITSSTQVYLRKWSKSILAPAGTQYARIYAMSGYASFPGGAMAAKTLYVFKAGLKPASELESRVETHSTTLATHDTRLATYAQRVSAGPGTAEFKMVALDSNGVTATRITARADEVALGSMTQIALRVAGGNALFSGNIAVGGGIFVGDAAIPVALQAFDMQVYDGQSVSYGANLGNLPKLDGDFSTFPALPAGQSYVFRADSHTPTGFIARVKKVTAATPVTQTSAAGTNPGSGPTFQAQKPTAADANDSNYNFSVSGAMYREQDYVETTPGNGKVVWIGWINFQTWFRAAGSSTWIAGPVVRMGAGSGTEGNSVPYSGRIITANFGSAIGQDASNTEFGISIYSSYSMGTNTLTALNSVSYNTLTGATESTATPSNLPLLPLKVTPQNG